jgi:hypothetical protein
MDMSDARLAFPKPEARVKTKRREDKKHGDHVSDVRAYVFGRERHICRCCRFRPAASMHEVKPKSLGGKVSRKNSVALCGDGVQGCHGFCQRHQIAVGASILGAEAELVFTPETESAAEWLRIKVGEQIVSPPMQETEIER